MRSLVLGDIHGNLEAFEAVLEDAGKQGGFDEVWCLGDVVGYGPDPSLCLRRLRELPHRALAGNHDLAAIGKLGIEDFNPEAATAALWTAGQLAAEDAAYLAGLPERIEVDGVLLVHGSPRLPVWEYLLSVDIAQMSFPAFEGRLCFVGHSHVPLVFRYSPATETCLGQYLPRELELEPQGMRYIVNPGGVGQPRDGDPAASYAIFDTGASVIYHYRVPYYIAATQAKMLRAGLPGHLIARLSYGR